MKYCIEKKGFCAGASIVFLLLACVFRVIGSIPEFGNRVYMIAECALPAVCCLLYILCIVAFGRKVFWMSVIPVLFGAAFFALTALHLDNRLYLALSLALYLLVVIIYFVTMFGQGRTKWLLLILILLVIAGHAYLKDWPLITGKSTATLYEIMLELSIVAMLLGLFFAVLGLKKKSKAKKTDEIIPPPMPGSSLNGKAPAAGDQMPVIQKTEEENNGSESESGKSDNEETGNCAAEESGKE